VKKERIVIDCQAYLARIGYQGSLVPAIETLRSLHLAHVLTVPFENLDIHLGRPISLEPPDLFRKIVVNRRGGYCFELSGLFALLLEDLGFSVTRLAARVLYGAEGIRPRSHQVLLVSIEGEHWVVDVGFGGNGLREPFRLAVGHEQEQGPDRFRLITDGRGDYLLQCEIDGAWTDLYSFTLEPNLPVDYTFANYYHSHSPDSLFTQRLMCTVPTLTGRTIFTDRRFKIRSDGATNELHVNSEEKFRQLLQEHFGLVVEGVFRSVKE
jgi:N-hydroxyarylamine O-acetyltransferase